MRCTPTSKKLILTLTAVLCIASVAATALALDTGARAPEIGLAPVANGSGNITIAGLRGRVVIVDFWATWCEPCAHAMPALQAIYQRHRGEGLEIVGVSQDRAAGPIAGFLRQHGNARFPVVFDGDHAVAGRYRPRAMPTTFIIDRQGIVRHIHNGYHNGDERQIEQEVVALLAQR